MIQSLLAGQSLEHPRDFSWRGQFVSALSGAGNPPVEHSCIRAIELVGLKFNDSILLRVGKPIPDPSYSGIRMLLRPIPCANRGLQANVLVSNLMFRHTKI